VAEVEYAMRKKGAERFAFPTFVNSGHRSHCLHGWAEKCEEFCKKHHACSLEITKHAVSTNWRE